MKPRITLVLCIHNHQPVGNYDWVLGDVFKKCYEPFVTALERHPGVRLALHYSGPLLEWMDESFTDRIRRLVENGQVELLTSGFYEPILPIVPFEDGVDQISAYTNLLTSKFGRRPIGFWLAERVWEPNIPRMAAKCHLEYTLTDDTHFLYAGLGPEELNGYYITEYQGACLRVFPISKRLRYLIPFREPQETIDYLDSFPDGSILVYGDDGEKFGGWPGTHRLVWGEGWLDKFFHAVHETEWIGLEHPSNLLANVYPRGRVYLPTASYDEMGEWSLPAKRQAEYVTSIESLKKEGKYEDMRAFLKGGYFRNFFAKYPEANRLHKKMVYVSEKVRGMREKGKARAKRELWQGQGNCAYWHGVFGGLYLPHLREALYSHLISAEVIADKESRGRSFLYSTERDLNCDGHTEIVIESSHLNLYVHEVGGRIFELDYRPNLSNLCNTLARREEAYHAHLLPKSHAKEEEHASIHNLVRKAPKNVEKHLIYDRTTKDSLIDHLLMPETTPGQFFKMQHSELADLAESVYQSSLRQSESEVQLVLRRQVRDWSVEKTLLVPSREAAIQANYHVRLNIPGEALFGVEFNLSLAQLTAPRESVLEIHLVDKEKGMALLFKFDTPAKIWSHPITTVSQSESGYELIYQGFCLMPVWRVTTPDFETQIRMEMSTC
jgi:alpha-amylase